jgi:hypothetical protein
MSNPGSDTIDAFLSGTYQRIRRMTILLSLAATGGALWFGWRSALGAAAGALVGYVNFVWLHHASTMMADRMIAPPEKAPSPFAIVLAFGGRYAFVIAMAYVIFRGWPKMLAGFTLALFLPVVAAVGEGIYEAFAGGNKENAV